MPSRFGAVQLYIFLVRSFPPLAYNHWSFFYCPYSAIYAPQTDFPVYQRSPRSKPISLPDADQAKHFDASYEVRNRGAAFYAFDKDEEVRARQMRELEEERRKTEMRRVQDELGDGDARAAVGGEDGLLGKAEIGKDEERRQKRRLEVEQKRKEIEAKRKRTRAD